jgi:hydrogenase maturation protein HypF
LTGWVRNDSGAVRLEAQGTDDGIESFLQALSSPPPAARVERIETAEVPVRDAAGFHILESIAGTDLRPALPADRAVCATCIAEIEDPEDRRFGYPFTNCTQCGPRYSIVSALPYDRESTSMSGFALCEACEREYTSPGDRRFHAEPIACPTCGPRVAFVARGARVAEDAEALGMAARSVLRGEILALQGLGGFHLLADATSDHALTRLRERKRRDEKPFAVMFGSLEEARAHCSLSPEEERLLASPEAPIVIVGRRASASPELVDAVAPGNPKIGAMLPYTPLHHLLLTSIGRPIVCTSGNLAEEPMCIDEHDARERLGGIADAFLVHDRPITRPIDDSVARADAGGPRLLRRARGYAPLPIHLPGAQDRCILATGGQLKSTVALSHRGDVVVSQHLGDLFSAGGVSLLERTARDLVRFFEARPEVVACDLHPDYASTRLAERLAAELGASLEPVQHHHAHVAACMAEHRLTGPVLGLAWDGAGLGIDGTIWGGEALVVDGAGFRRFGHLRPFSLPGGEKAMRDPSRSALGMLYEIFGPGAAAQLEMAGARAAALVSILRTGVSSPRTSSMGRLFDAAAALTTVRTRPGYEGQAAMELEMAAERSSDLGAYPIAIREGEPTVADWEPLVRALLEDRARGTSPSTMAARFHGTLVDLAEGIAERAGLARVVLSGGCFQNARLLASVSERLQARGFEVYTPRSFPPNDGGLSLGQLYVAALRRGAS